MNNEQVILDAVRQIQNRVAINDGLLVAIRSEIQHLGRRIDNLVGTSLLRLSGSRNEATDIMSAINGLSERVASYEKAVNSAPKAAAPRKPAAKKAAAKKPSKAAATKPVSTRRAAAGKRGR